MKIVSPGVRPAMILVEAAGIEPASENSSVQLSPSAVFLLNSRIVTPKDGLEHTVAFKYALRGQGGPRGALATKINLHAPVAPHSQAAAFI